MLSLAVPTTTENVFLSYQMLQTIPIIVRNNEITMHNHNSY